MPHTATDNATPTTRSTKPTRRLSRSAGIVVTLVAVLAVVGIDRGVAGKVKSDPANSAVKIRFVEQSALPAASNSSDNKLAARLASNVVKPTISIESTSGGSKKSAAPVELLHDLSNGPQTVTMEVTAYCPCPKCCGAGASGLTASGKRITYNNGRFVAADKVLPFGTKLVIPGYNNGESVEVLDRGGAIKGNKLDVFFPTHDQAKAWGRRMIAVTMVK